MIGNSNSRLRTLIVMKVRAKFGSSRIAAGIMLATILLVVSCSSKSQLDLRLHLNKSDTYNLRVTTDQSITQTVQGQEHSMTQSVAVGYSFYVTDVADDGTATVRVNYHSIKYKQTSPRGTVEYDSEDTSSTTPEQATLGLAALVGQTFTVVLSPSDEIVAVEGIDAMIDDMLSRFRLPDDSTREMLRQNFESQFGLQTMKETLAAIVGIYPGKWVSVGDSWEKTETIFTGFPMTLTDTYKLIGSDKGIATVSVNSTVSSNSAAPPFQMGPAVLDQNLTGNQTGTLRLNEDSGWIISADINQTLNGTMKVPPGPQVPNGMEWPLTVTTHLTMEQFQN